jgi:hypothetical protein
MGLQCSNAAYYGLKQSEPNNITPHELYLSSRANQIHQAILTMDSLESYNAELLKLTTIYHGLLLKLENVVGQILQVAYIRFLL